MRVVGVQVVGAVGLWWGQARGGGEQFLQSVKGQLAWGCPFPGYVLLKHLREGLGNVAVTFYKFPVVASQAEESS